MKLPRRRFLHLAAGAAALPAVLRIAKAQAYPARPVRVIVPFAAGGGTDITDCSSRAWPPGTRGVRTSAGRASAGRTSAAARIAFRRAAEGALAAIPFLRIVGALAAPTSMALACRWRSRPQHQNRTHAPQQRASLENLVSTAGQWQGNCNAERAGGLHVDVQLDLGYLLDRQVGRFFALEYAAGINACLTMRLQKTACVTHLATGDSEVARLVDRGNRVADS